MSFIVRDERCLTWLHLTSPKPQLVQGGKWLLLILSHLLLVLTLRSCRHSSVWYFSSLFYLLCLIHPTFRLIYLVLILIFIFVFCRYHSLSLFSLMSSFFFLFVSLTPLSSLSHCPCLQISVFVQQRDNQVRINIPKPSAFSYVISSVFQENKSYVFCFSFASHSTLLFFP